MVLESLGKTERRAYQTRDALAQGTVEPLNHIRESGALGANAMLAGRDDGFISFPVIGVKRGLRTILVRNAVPEFASAAA